jgi:hypothetical protein
MMNWKRLERKDRGLIEVLSQHLRAATMENHKKSVRIADVSAEIRTWHLLNTSLELSCSASWALVNTVMNPRVQEGNFWSNSVPVSFSRTLVHEFGALSSSVPVSFSRTLVHESGALSSSVPVSFSRTLVHEFGALSSSVPVRS